MSNARSILLTLLGCALWTALVVAGALLGWWRKPLAAPGDAAEFMRASVEIIERANRGSTAFVLIEDGTVWGEHYSANSVPIDRNTVFSVASLSKWVTAWGVMKLVEDGRLDLDRPVADYLTRWQLPPSRYDNRGVTARRLLSHTAGLTDGLGFGDYQQNELVPALEQSLENPRTSSGDTRAVVVGADPGSKWRYSGGGYLILELLVEEVSGETFEAFMQQAILKPLGMAQSGYSYLGDVDRSSGSFDQEGRPAPTYRYASKAATAFTSSAGDMARFVLAQLPVVTGKPLTQATIDAMRDPHGKRMGIDIWGLGTMLYAPLRSGDFVFGHDGTNEPAISASVRLNPETGDGLVVLVTGNQALASLLGFHWVFWQSGLPDFLGIPSEIQRVMPIALGGVLVILLLSGLLVWRHRHRRRAAAGALHVHPDA